MQEIDTLNDLLNADLSNIDTEYPVLTAGLYQFKFQAPQVVDTKKQDGNKNLKYEAVLESPSPANTTAGKTVSAGYKIVQTVYLPKPGQTDEKSLKATEIAQKNLASLKEALTGSKAGGFGNPQQYAGMSFMAQVKVENSPEFGERNSIARFLPKKS